MTIDIDAARRLCEAASNSSWCVELELSAALAQALTEIEELRDEVKRLRISYSEGGGVSGSARGLGVELSEVVEKFVVTERDSLRAEVERLRKLLPDCLGEWVDGSGGHRIYKPGCTKQGVWDVGCGFVCDEHRNKNGGDDDAWEWWTERDRLEEQLESARTLETSLTAKIRDLKEQLATVERDTAERIARFIETDDELEHNELPGAIRAGDWRTEGGK